MASLLACTLNSRIAAFAPVASLRWPAPCSGRPIPVLAFHGLADPQNPYAGHVEGRNGEWIESIPDALAGWAQHNGCRPGVIMEDPAGPLSTMRYEGCRDATEVRLIRIDGLGHAWPKAEIDATTVMWQFFKSRACRVPAKLNCSQDKDAEKQGGVNWSLFAELSGFVVGLIRALEHLARRIENAVEHKPKKQQRCKARR
jgi:hypothetical protein